MAGDNYFESLNDSFKPAIAAEQAADHEQALFQSVYRAPVPANGRFAAASELTAGAAARENGSSHAGLWFNTDDLFGKTAGGRNIDPGENDGRWSLNPREMRRLTGTSTLQDLMDDLKDSLWEDALKELGARPAGDNDIHTPWDRQYEEKYEQIYGPRERLE